jgi:hypothetical protein
MEEGLIKVGQLIRKLQKQSQELSQVKTEISVYEGGECTIPNVVLQIARLKKAFPQAPKEFYEILGERIRDKAIPDERLKDAVDNLIDNYHYPVPTIADIIGFDNKVKLLSYREMEKLAPQRPNIFDKYPRIKINGVLYWIEK